MKKKAIVIFLIGVMFLLPLFSSPAAEKHDETVNIRLLATSDMHGKFLPWLYALDQEDRSGSLAQISSAVKEFRDENTLLIDAGDVIQDNCGDLFIGAGKYPMVEGMNAIGYNYCTTGNHEYNFGPDVVKEFVRRQKAKVLLANVRDESGKPLSDGYAITEIGGVRVGLIGVVTPGIKIWDKENLEGWTVTNPIEEVSRITSEIDSLTDIIILIAHCDTVPDAQIEGTDVHEIAAACPDIDVIIAAHGHHKVDGEQYSGIPVVENSDMCRTMAKVDICVATDGDKRVVKSIDTEVIDISGYEPDPDIVKLLDEYDAFAKADARKEICEIKNGTLLDADEIKGIPDLLVKDTPLTELIYRMMKHYSGADAAIVSYTKPFIVLNDTVFTKSDLTRVFRFDNSLCKLEMTGAQLKKFMEKSASFYNRYTEGDLTVSFDSEKRFYNCNIVKGLNYEIDISQPAGERIKNLSWPDGKPVKDSDVISVAATDYDVKTAVLSENTDYGDAGRPVLKEENIAADIGGTRELMTDYLINVRGGSFIPEKSDNWRITGTDWNIDLRNLVTELVNSGKLTVPAGTTDRISDIAPIRTEDLKQLEQEQSEQQRE